MTQVAYIVSRFPTASETFVVRELNAVNTQLPIELFALFPPEQRFVHPAAERWVPVAHQPEPRRALRGALYWALRRPARMTRIVAGVVKGYWRSPERLVKSLVTVPIAASHARIMERAGSTTSTPTSRTSRRWRRGSATVSSMCPTA